MYNNVENFIVRNDKLRRNQDLIPNLFGEEFEGQVRTDPIIFVSKEADMYDILLLTGIFTTRSNAKRDWKRTGKEIPKGFSYFQKIGKRNARLVIWKPI